MTIYLVRHGKDEERYLGGWSQRGLIQEGMKQARLLGAYLEDDRDRFQFSRILSSDLKRAAQTAELISENINMPIDFDWRWRETNNGKLAGMPVDEFHEKYPGMYFSALDMDQKYPDGESPRENYYRIKEVFEELAKEVFSKNENVLVITHGGVINIIYHIVNGVEYSNKSALCKANNTSLHKIEMIEGALKVTLENSMEHMTESDENDNQIV